MRTIRSVSVIIVMAQFGISGSQIIIKLLFPKIELLPESCHSYCSRGLVLSDTLLPITKLMCSRQLAELEHSE
jgi:hypothetical protein